MNYSSDFGCFFYGITAMMNEAGRKYGGRTMPVKWLLPISLSMILCVIIMAVGNEFFQIFAGCMMMMTFLAGTVLGIVDTAGKG